MTALLNMHAYDPRLTKAVYIGRAGHGELGTFGNPFIAHSENERAWAVRSFYEHFYRLTRTNGSWRRTVELLRNKDLACFCAPKLCHGEVYLGYFNAVPSLATPLVFVFGSNLAGRHGAGAALAAHQMWGAEQGIGTGRTGDAYAIPTKDASLKTLGLNVIGQSVGQFVTLAKRTPSTAYVVTPVGCGLAGYRDTDIAPMFHDAPSNCILEPTWERLNGWRRA